MSTARASRIAPTSRRRASKSRSSRPLRITPRPWGVETDHHPHRRRLAGAVGSKEPSDADRFDEKDRSSTASCHHSAWRRSRSSLHKQRAEYQRPTEQLDELGRRATARTRRVAIGDAVEREVAAQALRTHIVSGEPSSRPERARRSPRSLATASRARVHAQHEAARPADVERGRVPVQAHAARSAQQRPRTANRDTVQWRERQTSRRCRRDGSRRPPDRRVVERGVRQRHVADGLRAQPRVVGAGPRGRSPPR